MKANSGLAPKNPMNHKGIDYRNNKMYQCVPGKGAIPEGDYYIVGNSVQQPDVSTGGLKYSTGGKESVWGPFRVPLIPDTGTDVCERSEFFFHLDVKNDGTAGCIGIAPSEEAKFNQIIALLMRLKADEKLPVKVRY